MTHLQNLRAKRKKLVAELVRRQYAPLDDLQKNLEYFKAMRIGAMLSAQPNAAQIIEFDAVVQIYEKVIQAHLNTQEHSFDGGLDDALVARDLRELDAEIERFTAGMSSVDWQLEPPRSADE
jgi:hypothetical protein